MNVEGLIKEIGQTEEFGSNGFTKRQVVVTTQDQYPQHIAIDFLKDKTSLLDGYQIGQGVNVSINLGGREWTSPQGEVKYFNSVTGWRIENADADGSANAPQNNNNPQEEPDVPF